MAFVAALAGFSAYQSRLHYEQQARTTADNLSQVLGNHISSATEKIDLVMKAVVQEVLQQRARGRVDSDGLQLFLVQHKLLLPDAADLLVADGHGRVGYGTDVSDSNIDISDRDYFQRLREYSHPGLVVSGPVQSRVDSRWSMIFARRLNSPDGSFAGAVVAVVHADRFMDMLSSLDLGPSGVVALHSQDMNLIARVPEVQGGKAVGAPVMTDPFQTSLRADPEKGAFTAVSPLDHVERSFVYRRLPDLPLYIVVGHAAKDYLAAWWKECLQLAGIAAAFAFITLWFSRAARRAVKRQEATSQLMQEAVNSVALGFSIFDREDRLVICNEAGRDFFTDCREAIVPGARFEDIIHAGALRGGLSGESENPEEWIRERIRLHREADGKPFELKLRDGRRLLIIEHRTASGHTVINRIDITELARHRDQLEQMVEARTAELSVSAARFRATFEQAGVGVCHTDMEGRFLQVNDKFCAIVGYGREELLGGMDFQSITHPDDIRGNLEARAQLLAGTIESYSMEKRYICRDGIQIWGNLTVALVRTAAGEPDYFTAVVEDIQQRKDMAKALAEEREIRQKLLEQEVAARTSELQAANSQLEGFLYAASHDLKGPLGRISSFSSLLEKNYRDRLEGDGLLFLGFIRENALRLTRLIDDLLSHARIDQQVTRLQPISLLDAVRTVLQEKAEDIQEQGTSVRLDLPPAEVLADSYGLKQVLDNLLENALKYSAQAAEPEIEIGGEESGGHFRLWVRDNGIGFDMAYQDKIFEIFRRLHTYAEYSGSGVGLALVKRAMERMGGRVWAESEPGRGATFFLEFQLAVCETT